MGIPKFFRWLTRRYPLILKNITKEEDCPPIDNLYLDLNGIVHNCIHGNDAKLHERVSKLKDFDEVWANILKAIDEIVHTVKPRQLLFLAVDGVAPRAKMNQQRARRFRSAKDSQMLKDQLLKEGKEAPDLFDSNAISPGTKFMFDLNRQLEFFVQYKLNTDHLYQNLEVVLSDSSVPGEGEHKMMDHIRQAKTQPYYNPNTRHCFYGADADLIMLSLLTHEPNFMIIREEHVVKKIKQGGVQRLDIQKTFNFQLIFISLLREYFALEYQSLQTQMRMRFDLERIIDDFVFFCFFIGNDFLPSLSALDISEGSLDSLIDLYKSHLPSMTDYITEAGTIYWDRAEPFIRMLGDHELESFKMRIDSIRYAKAEKIVSFEADFGKIGQGGAEVDRKTLIKNKIREKLNEKKLTKIFHLKQKNTDKRYKKFLLMRRFDEDGGSELSKYQKEIRVKLVEKYRAVRDKQNMSPETKSESELVSDDQPLETLKDIINDIKEEYFSDLNIDDIHDDEVSDVDENEIDIDNVKEQEQNPILSKKLKVQEEIIDKYSEANLKFMTEFIKLFSNDPVKAKAFYYSEKLKVDVMSGEGVAFKKRMLMKYLEGLQWVLYYYYKGAQHWRWYYPYHYAPMISDIDENIVQNFLSGQVTIKEFQIDANCSDINVPYTPFQQLLCIMPTKSLGFLPEGYATIAKGDLKDFFPPDFDIDLNGRALPWEACCLIPFVDEKLFIENEKLMMTNFVLDDYDKKRNQIYFYFKKFTLDTKNKRDPEIKGTLLPSTISKIQSIESSYVKVQLLYDYQDVGKHSFLPKLLSGLQQPCTDFPSFKWIGANSVDYDEKVINKVPFKRVLIKVPSCLEERSNADLEAFVNKFAKSLSKEIYIDLPFQIEAFPTVFEDERFTYTLYGDVYSNIYKIHKENQQMDFDKYSHFARRQKFNLQDQGFMIENAKAFVTLNKVKEVRYDNKAHQFYKVYDEQSDVLPISILMYKRDPAHFLNVNVRCNSFIQSFIPGNQVLCLNTQLFGVVGTVNSIDMKRNLVRVDFDKETEETKIHDPFFGMAVLKKEVIEKQQNGKRYFSDIQIEQEMRLPRGYINKITGSFLVTFNDRENFEKAVIDLGFNIKNFTKKVHIPDYVRFVADHDSLANYQHDDYTHNTHAKGARHVRKHWEYSEECVAAIKEYKQNFPEVFEGLHKSMKANKQLLTLQDLFGKKFDETAMIRRIKEAASWIEKQPLSHLPYIEMGFDALDQELIQALDKHKTKIRESCSTVQLKCKESEVLQPNFLYQDTFPFWCQPYSSKSVEDYGVGDRVININSSKRESVPFGLRGTVVGHTNDKVIVLFDEKFLGGNNIFGHCQDFKGGYINPNFLINLSHKFQQLLKKGNADIVNMFTEQPLEGNTEGKAILQARQEYLKESQQQKENDQIPPQTGMSQAPHMQQQYQHQQRQYNKKPYQKGGNYNNAAAGGSNNFNQQQNQRIQKPAADQSQGGGAVEEEEKKQGFEQKSQNRYRVKQMNQPYSAQSSGLQQLPSHQSLDDQDNEESYQDLKALQRELSNSSQQNQLQQQQNSFGGHRNVSYQHPQQQYVPMRGGFQQQQQQPANNNEEIKQMFAQVMQSVNSLQISTQQQVQNSSQAEGFTPSLQQNPDFQQLMNLMNTVASQLQMPIFVPTAPAASVPEYQPPSDGQQPSKSDGSA